LRRSVSLRTTGVGMVAGGGNSLWNHLICPASKSSQAAELVSRE
jgi:hypothetical protein